MTIKNPFSFRVFSRVSRAIILPALVFSTSAVFGVVIVGHRGASIDAPENSLSAMKLAWKQGADGIETDIHLSKDGKIVVMHDYDTKRTGGVNKKIVESTWDELKDVDVAKAINPKFAPEKIPTLDSIWATIPDGKFIFTELKIHDTAILAELEKAMKASGKTKEQLQFHTFLYDMAQALKEKFPDHKVYWLAGWSKDKKTGEYPKLDDLIAKAKAAHLDGINLQGLKSYTNGAGFPIDKAFVKKIHDAGLKIYPWTIDNAEVARKLVEAGVDGIISNRPAWLREQLSTK